MTLAIDAYGADLRKEGDELIVLADGVEKTFELPLIERLILTSGASLSHDLLMSLLGRGIPTTFLSRDGDYVGRLEAPGRGGIARARAQFRERPAQEVLSIATELVGAKVANQSHLVRAAKRHNRIPSHLATPDPVAGAQDIEQLMGIEGMAARTYWSALRHMIPESWGFPGRTGRGANDPVNACLNYLYAILLSEVVESCHRAGLHPDAGFLHADRPGRPSLAIDLMEPLRPWLVDRLLLRMIGQNRLDRDGFEPGERGRRIAEPNREALIGELLRELNKEAPANGLQQGSWSQVLHAQTEALASHLLNPQRPFKAVRVKR